MSSPVLLCLVLTALTHVSSTRQLACSQQELAAFSPRAEPSTSQKIVFLMASCLRDLHRSERASLTNASDAADAAALLTGV